METTVDKLDEAYRLATRVIEHRQMSFPKGGPMEVLNHCKIDVLKEMIRDIIKNAIRAEDTE